MPGAPIMHGYATSASPAGEGGAGRVESFVETGGSLLGIERGSSFSFIVWLVIVGVVIPGVILGGLKFGGFEFVFRNRR